MVSQEVESIPHNVVLFRGHCLSPLSYKLVTAADPLIFSDGQLRQIWIASAGGKGDFIPSPTGGCQSDSMAEYISIYIQSATAVFQG